MTEHHPVWVPAQAKCTRQTTKDVLKKGGIFLYLGVVPPKFRQPKRGTYLVRAAVCDFLLLHKPAKDKTDSFMKESV